MTHLKYNPKEYDLLWNAFHDQSRQLEIIDEFIEEAYEGLVIVDAEGRITKFNYEKLLGIQEADALGKHVTDVIENTRLHKVIQTGKAEVGDVQKIQGHEMITTRIPIKRGGKVVGAVGTVLFRDIGQVKYLADYIEQMKSTVKKYKKEIKRLNQAKYSFDSILTQNDHMKNLKKVAKLAAETHSTVCIEGESGTGKEYFSHAIHAASMRKYGPFVKINCAAIPKDLLESELFGYEPGAFTGASSSGKVGKFELASGGTIFLDEIGSLPLAMQAKLLRVIEERELERIGGNEKIDVDVRIISATNEDLRSLVSKGKFREDLYYRLDVVSLHIPPLRDRKEDIPLLAESFLKQFRTTLPNGPTAFSAESMEALGQYNWPGNVRELRNVVESAMNFARNRKIYSKDLPDYISTLRTQEIAKDQPAPEALLTDLDIRQVVAKAERMAIEKAIQVCEGNKSEAAKLLGIHRTVMYKKMDKLGME